MIRVKIEGGAELSRRLRDIPGKLHRRAVMQALTAGGRVVRDRAKELVDVRSGDLRDSITVARTAMFAERDPNPHVFVGPRAAMGARGSWEELGTIKQAADPFLRPALDTKASEVAQAVADRLRQELDNLGR